MSSTFPVGYSSCPNDTFMFHGLVHGRVPTPGLRWEPWMADIEELNRRAAGDEPLPFTKLSMAAYARVADRYRLLDAGAALGRGNGPLVVVRDADRFGDLNSMAGEAVAIPGEGTTAWLLLRILGGGAVRPVPMRFDHILPAVAAGKCAGGLIIHESRFTYRDHGLRCVADLGELWEAETGLPLPLGLIAARRDLDPHVVTAFTEGLRASVRGAFADPAASRDYVRQHAQEMDEAVTRSHIDLYVNAFSESLGDEGRAAVDAILERGRACGAIPVGSDPWA